MIRVESDNPWSDYPVLLRRGVVPVIISLPEVNYEK